MARAATSDELALLRSSNQWTKLFLYIHNPETVFTAQLDSLPNSNDQVTKIAYKNAAGSTGDVIDGMTCLVGTTAGACDVGFIRIRAIDTTSITLGETSEIVWQTDLYLTILDDFEFWGKKLAFLGGSYTLENDTPYVEQYSKKAPVPVMGPYFNVLKLTGSTVSLSMDASASWVPGGSISAYSWAAHGPAAVTFSDAAAAAPTLTFSLIGTFRISCTVTANDYTTTGYRYIYVYDTAHPLLSDFTIDTISGSRTDGWSFKVDWYNTVAMTLLKDRSVAVLVAEDHYGDTIQSIGPIPGYEHIVAIGRIKGSSIKSNPELNDVSFSVQGNAWWLQNTISWPFTLMDTHAVKSGGTPLAVDWMHMDGLTIDAALWCWSIWRSTIVKSTDVYPTSDTRRAFSSAGNLGALWDQIKTFSDAIGAFPACDRYGRLFVQIDIPLLADRSSIPTVMAITKQDWVDDISITKLDHLSTGWYEGVGFNYNGTNFDVVLSTAPGNSLAQFGNVQTKNNLVASSQSAMNALVGRLLSRQNNLFPVVDISLASNNRLIDVAGQQYVTLSLALGDTSLGIVWTNKKLIINWVELRYEADSGALLTSIEAAADTDGPAGVTIIPPTPPGNPNPPGPGTPIHPIVPPPGIWFPPIIGPKPTDDCKANKYAPETKEYTLYFNPTQINGGSFADASFSCFIRPSDATYLTRIEIAAMRFGVSWSDVTVQAIGADQSVLATAAFMSGSSDSGTIDLATYRFSPGLSGASVAGFRISVASGAIVSYSLGSFIKSDTVAGNNSSGIAVTGLTIGQWYSIESSGGPFYFYGPSRPDFYGYSPQISEGGDWYHVNEGPAGFISATDISMEGKYSRAYFQASTTQIYFRVDDSYFSDNSGDLSYILRNAIIQPASLLLSGVGVINVCKQ